MAPLSAAVQFELGPLVRLVAVVTNLPAIELIVGLVEEKSAVAYRLGISRGWFSVTNPAPRRLSAVKRQTSLVLMAILALVVNGCIKSDPGPIAECTMTDSSGLEWRAEAPVGQRSEAEASVLDSCLAESKDPNSCQNASCSEIPSQ